MNSPLLQFLLKKFLRVIVILVSVAFITFLLMHAIPGSPWNSYFSSRQPQIFLGVDEAWLREINHRFGLDLPLWRQFTRYMIGDWDETGRFFCGAVCGNLGPSIRQRGRTVVQVLFQPPERQGFWQSRFGYSIRLVFLGTILSVGLGIPLGIVSAIRPRSALSRGIAVLLAALISIPNFVLGLLAIVVLASWLKIMRVLPDWSDPGQWIIPALVLAVMPLANIARVTQATLMNIAHEDYIRTARAKGLTFTRVILVHMLRSALAPILTFLGPTIMEMFTGSLIVESLFSFPGFGREYWEAVLRLDYPVIMGLTLIYACGILFLNGLIEMICAALDPRIRFIHYQGAP